MKILEIEAWALRVIAAVERGERVEDAKVELKAMWPDPIKAARRLAGHANAARGENILWLIGIDEHGALVGAAHHELSAWFATVQSAFDGITPAPQDVNVVHKEKSFAALCFETNRAPYVVKNPTFGKTAGETVDLEVPWRGETRIRSATRNELLLLLTPLIAAPKAELLECEITFSKETPTSKHLSLKMDAYIVPPQDTLVVFPFHRTILHVLVNNQPVETDAFFDISPAPRKRMSSLVRQMGNRLMGHSPQVNVSTGNEVVESTNSEILIRAPAKIVITGLLEIQPEALGSGADVEVRCTLSEAMSDTNISLTCKGFRRTDWEKGTNWRLAKADDFIPGEGHISEPIV